MLLVVQRPWTSSFGGAPKAPFVGGDGGVAVLWLEMSATPLKSIHSSLDPFFHPTIPASIHSSLPPPIHPSLLPSNHLSIPPSNSLLQPIHSFIHPSFLPLPPSFLPLLFKKSWDLPGGPAVKAHTPNAGGLGLILGQQLDPTCRD